MLNIIRNWQLQDYLRDLQSNRGYGLQITPDYILPQITGAYAESSGTISYFVAHQIDDGYSILSTFIIEEDRLIYENGQYQMDKTKILNGSIPEGVYFIEFNDGKETYFSEIFKVEVIDELAKASCANYVSGDDIISDLNIETNGFLERLKEFAESDFVEFAT